MGKENLRVGLIGAGKWDGFVGEVYHLQGFEENAQLVDPNTPLPRIGFSCKTDRGALHGYGSHLLDLVRWTLGEFEQVIGDMATFIKERPVLGENERLPVPASYRKGHDPSVNWPQDYYTALVRHFIERVRKRDITEGSSDFSDGLACPGTAGGVERSHFERRWVTLKEVAE